MIDKPTGPFHPSKTNRDDWQMPGPSGPATKRRAKAMRKPPFKKRPRTTDNALLIAGILAVVAGFNFRFQAEYETVPLDLPTHEIVEVVLREPTPASHNVWMRHGLHLTPRGEFVPCDPYCD